MREVVFALAAEMIQVSDSIAWVSCASGNVYGLAARSSSVRLKFAQVEFGFS